MMFRRRIWHGCKIVFSPDDMGKKKPCFCQVAPAASPPDKKKKKLRYKLIPTRASGFNTTGIFINIFAFGIFQNVFIFF